MLTLHTELPIPVRNSLYRISKYRSRPCTGKLVYILFTYFTRNKLQLERPCTGKLVYILFTYFTRNKLQLE